MSRGRGLWWPMLVAGLVCAWSGAAAAAPWDALLTNNRLEADPQQSYDVTERNGPWMIMACSFSGPLGRQQAQDLVIELRKRYKLPAYTYELKLDLSKDLPTRLDSKGKPRKMQYQRKNSEIDEIAVLVGNYPAVDAPEAQETLRKLRYYQPDCLKLDNGKPTARSLAGWRILQTALLSPANETKQRGPMGFAFVTTNPVLPKEAFVPKGVDDLILKSNEGVDHCLLDCPGRFTVQVAVFTGRIAVFKGRPGIDQKDMSLRNQRNDVDGQLADAALEAHELTEALRIKGYEAYEFHDRCASIVTVGSFQSAGATGTDGLMHLDPQVQRVIDQFKADTTKTPQNPRGLPVPQRIVGITLDMQPLLVHVPKRPTDSLLRQENVRVTRLP